MNSDMMNTTLPTLGETLEAMTEWAAQKQPESDRSVFKTRVETAFSNEIGGGFSDLPNSLAERSFNELCFILANLEISSSLSATANFDNICAQLVATIGFGGKRTSRADVLSAMNALKLLRLSERAVTQSSRDELPTNGSND
jgi:hypothetical protein